MNCGKKHVRIGNVAYISCKNDNGLIPKKSIIEKPHDSYKTVVLSMIFESKSYVHIIFT